MKVTSSAGPSLVVQPPSPEEMIAIAAARPAILQLQQVAIAATHRGISGQGTPAIDSSGKVDFYA